MPILHTLRRGALWRMSWVQWCPLPPNIHPPGTYEWTLFGKQIFADGIKSLEMRSSHFRVGLSPGTGALIRKEETQEQAM